MKNVSKNVDGLGLRIAQSRIKQKLSQNAVSDFIGMSRPNYTAIENEVSGRFLKDYQLRDISTKLKVSSDYLLGLISDPNPNAEIMSVVNTLGISGNAIKSIQSLNSPDTKDELYALDDFIKYFDFEFWETLALFKKLQTLIDNEYSFILEFEKDIENNQIDIYNHKNIDFSIIQSEYKYYYFNLKDAEKYHKIRNQILEDFNYNYSEAFSKIELLWKTDEYTERFLHLYQDKSKLDEFKYTLERIKKILHNIVMLLDFDETGLIFSTYEKEEQISKIIDELIKLIDESSSKAIDDLILNLHSCLSFFTKTIDSTLTFLKYKITNEFNNYLKKGLKL